MAAGRGGRCGETPGEAGSVWVFFPRVERVSAEVARSAGCGELLEEGSACRGGVGG